jgi:glucose-6-phosphate isomerase
VRILFDETNLLAEVVGRDNGISRSEAERARPKALKALKAFRKRSEDKTIGFPHLPFHSDVIKSVNDFAASVRGSYDTVCVVGIGGSGLGPWALDCGIRGPHPVQEAFSTERPRLVILDNVDPSFTKQAIASMRPEKTIVVVITKSGNTAETLATFLIVREWLNDPKRIVAITTEGSGDLFKLAEKEGYRLFFIDKNVGGRFSVLTPVGLVPAALIGIDIKKLCRGAAAMTHICWQEDLAENVALRAALYHWLVWTRKGKPIQVAFPYSNHLWGTAFWFRQLWAESLGKAVDRTGQTIHTGQTPVAALGVTDQHSQVQLYIEGPNDKVFTFWAVEKFSAEGKIPKVKTGLAAFDALSGQSLAKLIDAERRATAAAMVENGRPNCTVTLGRVDEEHLGAFLQMMEFQTAFIGELLNIDAFDQPGVELGKVFTYALMGRAGYEKDKQRITDIEARGKKA